MNGEIINLGDHKEIPKEPIEQENCFELKIDRIFIKISTINKLLNNPNTEEIHKSIYKQFREELMEIFEESFKEEYGEKWKQKLYEKIEELKKISVPIDRTKD